MVEKRGAYYNTKALVSELEALLRKLPNPSESGDSDGSAAAGRYCPSARRQTDAAAHRGLPRRSQGARAGRPIRDQPADGRQDPHPQRRPRQPPRPDARPSRRGSTPTGGRSHGSASTSASRPGRCSSGCGSGASSCAAVIGGIRWRETDRHRLRRCRHSLTSSLGRQVFSR